MQNIFLPERVGGRPLRGRAQYEIKFDCNQAPGNDPREIFYRALKAETHLSPSKLNELMGFLDKVMFWKKDDELDFDKLAQEAMKREELGQENSNNDWGMEHSPMGSPDRPLFPQDQTNQNPASDEFKVPPIREQPNQFQTPANTQFQSQSNSLNPTNPQNAREIELINSKLDTIKAMLNSIDQRLNSIESEKKETKKLW